MGNTIKPIKKRMKEKFNRDEIIQKLQNPNPRKRQAGVFKLAEFCLQKFNIITLMDTDEICIYLHINLILV